MDSELTEHDLRFRTPCTFLLAGPSQCGKTSFLLNVLRSRHEMFDVAPDHVIYFYNRAQPIFKKFKDLVAKWINALPTADVLNEMTLPQADGRGTIVVIDDFMQQINADISTLFTVLCHANRATVFLLTQNIFASNPAFRTISLNTTYMAIFKNPRDSAQINHLAKQLSPGNPRWVVDAFRACTQSAYSYMLVDNHQKTDESIRVRSNVLQSEWPMIAYMPKGYTPSHATDSELNMAAASTDVYEDDAGIRRGTKRPVEDDGEPPAPAAKRVHGTSPNGYPPPPTPPPTQPQTSAPTRTSPNGYPPPPTPPQAIRARKRPANDEAIESAAKRRRVPAAAAASNALIK